MLSLNDLTIRPHEALRLALGRMTRNRQGILFVCDEDLHLVGTLSDGDVRRTLLEETLLVASVSKAMNMDPITAPTIESATELLRRLGLVAVPVVGEDGRVKEAVVEIVGELTVIRPAETIEKDGIESGADTGALAIIPARGGSKRIPRKNLAMAGGKSLLAWAVLAAQQTKRVGRVLVTTDDPEIAEAARAYGAQVPWLRPEEFARDDTPTLDVVMHTIKWATQALKPVPEFAVLLEPTAPLRTPQQIDEALDLLAASDADSAVSVCEVPHPLNPEELLIIEDGKVRPSNRARTMNTVRLRGHQAPAYVRSGLVYALRTASVLAQRSLYGQKAVPLLTGWEYFLDVDTPRDLQLADFLLRLKHKSE